MLWLVLFLWFFCFSNGFNVINKRRLAQRNYAEAIRYVTQKGSGNIVLSEHFPTFNINFPGVLCPHSDPPVFEISDFLSSAQCDSYIAKFEAHRGKQAGSETVNLISSRGTRTSTTRYMDYADCTDFIRQIKLLLGLAPNHEHEDDDEGDGGHDTLEEPQVVKYSEGQMFTNHYDAIQPHLQDTSGNRLATIIVYLNTLTEGQGGETYFRDLNMGIKPRKGSALVFFPSFSNGVMDDRTIHCGLQPATGHSKYILQCWVRQGKYEPKMRQALMSRQITERGGSEPS